MPEQREFSTVSLPNNVQDAMRDNLPGQVSKILRDELEKGAAAMEENETLLRDIKKVEARLDEHGELASTRRQHKAREKAVAEKEAMLDERERDIRVLEMKIELEAANKYGIKLEGVLGALVRNVEWRSELFDSKTHENGMMVTDTKTRTEKAE
jgi:hypothetical protein